MVTVMARKTFTSTKLIQTMNTTTVCFQHPLRCLQLRRNRTLTWSRVRGPNQEYLWRILQLTVLCNTHVSTGTYRRSASSRTHQHQREVERQAPMQEFRPMRTITPTEKYEARAKNVGKYTEWKTDISGAHSAVGRKLVCGSPTELLA